MGRAISPGAVFGDPGKGMGMEVTIRALPEQRVAALLHEGPYWLISRAFGQLSRFVVPAGLLDLRRRMVAVYHDDPKVTPPAKLRSSAGILLTEGERPPPGLDELVLPSGRFACYEHLGAYERLGGAWAELLEDWLPQSGEVRDTAAPNGTFELYLNHPGEVPSSQLRTELYCKLSQER